jgi:hypothetical protein
MKKRLSIKLSSVVAALVAGVVAYYLLLCHNAFHSSISEIIYYSNGLKLTKHILVLGLLPIYIAAMVFGAVLLGIYLRSLLQNAIHKAIKN